MQTTLALLLFVGSVTVSKSVAKLTAPKDLVATETVVELSKAADEERCAAGLRYGSPTRSDGLRLLSTKADFLRPIEMQGSFEQIATLGTLPGKGLNITDLFCEDRGFDLIQVMGRIELKAFKAATWVVGDFGQDSCGETTVVVFGKNADTLVAAAVKLDSMTDKTYSCGTTTVSSDKDCAERIRCVQSYLSTPATRAALEEKLAASIGALSFKAAASK